MPKKLDKTCFVIAPISGEGSESRKWSNEVLEIIIRPAVSDFGYNAIRADEIQKTGNITSQVIQRCIDSDLVVANLTDLNPNVFYEMAIRHAIGRPIIQIIRKDQIIPFDIIQERTLTYDKDSPSSFLNCQNQLRVFLKNIEEDNMESDNPIARAIGLMTLAGSDNPLEKATSDIVSMLQNLTSSVLRINDRIGIIDLRTSSPEPTYISNPFTEGFVHIGYIGSVCSRCLRNDVIVSLYRRINATALDSQVLLCSDCAGIMRGQKEIE